MKNIEIAARKTPSQAILRVRSPILFIPHIRLVVNLTATAIVQEKEELAKSGKGMKLDLSKGPG